LSCTQRPIIRGGCDYWQSFLGADLQFNQICKTWIYCGGISLIQTSARARRFESRHKFNGGFDVAAGFCNSSIQPLNLSFRLLRLRL
jgi:hypothetical protein